MLHVSHLAASQDQNLACISFLGGENILAFLIHAEVLAKAVC